MAIRESGAPRSKAMLGTAALTRNAPRRVRADKTSRSGNCHSGAPNLALGNSTASASAHAYHSISLRADVRSSGDLIAYLEALADTHGEAPPHCSGAQRFESAIV